MWLNAPSQFSIKLPARRYATGIVRVRVACSIRCVDVIRPNPLVCSEPIDERNTALPGFACSSASRMAAIVRFWSGSPAAGAKSGGIIANTPSAPANAFASPAASSYADCASSTPRSAQAFAFSGLRTTPRTVLPAASRPSHTAPTHDQRNSHHCEHARSPPMQVDTCIVD